MKAIWKGQKLDVPAWWNKYTDEAKQSWCNGIGAEGQHPRIAAALAKLPAALQLPSDIHDGEYHVGGDSRDRLRADRRWRRNVIGMASRLYGPWWKRLYTPTLRLAHSFAVASALVGYRALRVWGGNAFHYTAIEDKHIENKDAS